MDYICNSSCPVQGRVSFFLDALIKGDTPADHAARAAVDFLKMAITQQGQYSEGVPYIDGTPYRSMSRQEEPPAPTASGSLRHHRVPLTPPGGLRIMDLPAPNTNQRVESAAQIPPQEPNTEFISRSVGNRCRVPALRNTCLPPDFKGSRKIPNYTVDMDPRLGSKPMTSPWICFMLAKRYAPDSSR